MFLVVLLIFVAGCHTGRRGQFGDGDAAVITLSNDWVEEGEDEVVLVERGAVRLTVPLRAEKSVHVKAHASMKHLALSFVESGRYIEFLAGVRPGHSYMISCSPCCLLLIEDEEDDPYEFPGETFFTDSAGRCPPGTIPIFPGLAEDPDGKHRCIPAPRIRFKIPGEVLEKGSVVVLLGKGLGNEQVQVTDEAISSYRPFDIVQSGTPITVSLLRNEQLIWEGMVVFRVKHSYSFEYNPSEKPPVSITLDD